MEVPRRLTGPLNRVGAAAQNALEVARFGGLETDKRPAFVQVVGEIPVTTWYRPVTAPLGALGVPDGKARPAWRLGEDGEYEPLAPQPAPAAPA